MVVTLPSGVILRIERPVFKYKLPSLSMRRSEVELSVNVSLRNRLYCDVMTLVLGWLRGG
jgi:hypothetical protein